MKASRVVLLFGATAIACADSGQQSNDDAAMQKAATPAKVDATAADSLLTRAIAHHDPEGAWPTFRGTLQLEELRPDGNGRAAAVILDVPAAGVRYQTSRDGRVLIKDVDANRCDATVDGRPPTLEEAETYALTCDQLLRSRNYYLFLWGLPMKLRDPGTQVDPAVTRTEFQGEAVDAIRVTYDPDVGSDVWYFYFEPETAALRGYRFYHDESANDGEYITLESELEVGPTPAQAPRGGIRSARVRVRGASSRGRCRLTAHPPSPPPLRPRPREPSGRNAFREAPLQVFRETIEDRPSRATGDPSAGPSCSLASTTYCRCSVPPAALR